MSRVIRMSMALVLVLSLAGAGSVAAKQSQGPTTEPAPSGTFEFAAGEPCAFPVRLEPVIDELFATTWPARPNGDVISWYHGRATARAINLATQKSFEFDNSGSLLAVFHADGSVDVRYAAPSLLWNLSEEPGPDGIWMMKHGSASEHYDVDGNLTDQRLPGRGALIDVCKRLG